MQKLFICYYSFDFNSQPRIVGIATDRGNAVKIISEAANVRNKPLTDDEAALLAEGLGCGRFSISTCNANDYFGN